MYFNFRYLVIEDILYCFRTHIAKHGVRLDTNPETGPQVSTTNNNQASKSHDQNSHQDDDDIDAGSSLNLNPLVRIFI